MSNRIVQLLNQQRPIVMGILNTTPDSFSDGGDYLSASNALDHAQQMIAEGADIIDIGGESTRPGAQPVALEDEINRVVPVISEIRNNSEIAISIDTSKPEVMRAAVAAGADLVNDVNALRAESAVETCAELAVPVCLMHMQGEPRTMQHSPQYENVVEDVADYLQQRMQACVQAGIKKERIIVDPGFGFGKTLAHNLSLLKHLDALQALGLPLLIGISRKSMIGAILDAEVDQRLHGSVAAAVLAFTRGAKIFRVHDVKPTVDALKVCDAMSNAQ
ncbi:MAG: dihydropteroate synthase [Gammaproteobacteria bacterium]|nr:dihydropteroate synthase [Gammaproteobacteria bacterium]